MKRLMFAAGVLSLLAFGACKKDAQKAPENVKAGVLPDGSTLPGIISTQVELVANGTYYLDGKTYVQPGGDLVINAGVTVKGISKSTPAEASALVITRGGQIHADGTNGTIVFTSNNATPAVGDWGGIVILGNAPTNQSNPTIEGIDLPTLPPGVDVHYGGTTSGDNSGVLKYVRIEWAGANVSTNNELNSLTLGGVGSGTTIDHVQASYGRDDAFEFFGGTVNASYLVSLNTNDDILDFDHGYQGSVQYVLGIRRSGFTYNDANGIESDNEATGTCPALTPITNAQVSNATFIGGQNAAFAGTLNAGRLRRSTGYTITNSIFLGYNNGFAVEGACTAGTFTGNVVHAFSSLGTIPAGNETHLNGTDSNADIALVDPFAVGANFDPSETQHPGKGAIVGGNYWYLGWTAGL
ncbi:hypothetical protein [Chitinophaga lutea]|nr:hypothetical protein [Chitinophaga lutea]